MPAPDPTDEYATCTLAVVAYVPVQMDIIGATNVEPAPLRLEACPETVATPLLYPGAALAPWHTDDWVAVGVVVDAPPPVVSPPHAATNSDPPNATASTPIRRSKVMSSPVYLDPC